MVAGHDLDERGVAASGVPVAMLQPEGFAQPDACLGKHHPQQSVADRPAPLHALWTSQLAHASPMCSICRGVSTGGAAGRGLAHTDHRLATAFTTGDVFQQRLVPAATAMRDPLQVSTHVHAVEHVVVVAGDHRAQPRGDRRLDEPRRPALDRRDLGSVSGAQPRQEGPEALQRHRIPAQPERIQILPPQRQRPRIRLHRVRRRPLRPQVLQVLLSRLDHAMVRAQHRPRVLA